MKEESFVEEVCRVLGASVVSSSGLSSFSIRVEVEEGAPEPSSIEEVRILLGDCRRCKLCSNRTNLVFGGGPPAPKLMVVGEGPGEHEDRLGEPFVGRAGEMLDRMLSNVLQIRRDEVFVTNVVKCRTSTDNREPESDEVEACMPFLSLQRNVLRPPFALLLGGVAIEAVLGLRGGVRSNRGKWFDWDGTATISTYHPAYLLRRPEDKGKALEDLKMLLSRMSGGS